MTHSGRTSRRKPDVALVSLSEAQAASGDDKCEWARLAFEIATKSPQKDFQWRSVLSVAEFKRTKDLSSPPTEYTLELEVIEPPKFSSVGEVKDLPAQEVTQLSVGTKPKLSNHPSSVWEEVTRSSVGVMLNPSNPSSPGKPPPTKTKRFLSVLKQVTLIGLPIYPASGSIVWSPGILARPEEHDWTCRRGYYSRQYKVRYTLRKGSPTQFGSATRLI